MQFFFLDFTEMLLASLHLGPKWKSRGFFIGFSFSSLGLARADRIGSTDRIDENIECCQDRIELIRNAHAPSRWMC